MRRPSHTQFAAAAIAAILVAIPFAACACVPVRTTPAEFIERVEAAAVFAGRIVAVDPYEPHPDEVLIGVPRSEVTFEVETWLRGLPGPAKVVIVGTEGSCTTDFAGSLGERWLVFSSGASARRFAHTPPTTRLTLRQDAAQALAHMLKSSSE